MSELDKVLEWVVGNVFQSERGEAVKSVDLVLFIDLLKNPPKKLIWQCRTVSRPEWRNISDEEFDLFQHLSRFEFQHVEV